MFSEALKDCLIAVAASTIDAIGHSDPDSEKIYLKTALALFPIIAGVCGVKTKNLKMKCVENKKSDYLKYDPGQLILIIKFELKQQTETLEITGKVGNLGGIYDLILKWQ